MSSRVVCDNHTSIGHPITAPFQRQPAHNHTGPPRQPFPRVPKGHPQHEVLSKTTRQTASNHANRNQSNDNRRYSADKHEHVQQHQQLHKLNSGPLGLDRAHQRHYHNTADNNVPGSSCGLCFLFRAVAAAARVCVGTAILFRQRPDGRLAFRGSRLTEAFH